MTRMTWLTALQRCWFNRNRTVEDFVFVGVGTTYDFSDVFSAGLAYNTEVNHLNHFNHNRAVLDIRFRF